MVAAKAQVEDGLRIESVGELPFINKVSIYNVSINENPMVNNEEIEKEVEITVVEEVEKEEEVEVEAIGIPPINPMLVA